MDDMFRVSGTNLTVFVPKELDHHIAEMLNQKTDWIMEQKNIRRIVFDFRETDFMDSSGDRSNHGKVSEYQPHRRKSGGGACE